MKAANLLCPSHSGMRGFSLLELMTAVAILAILLGIGVPSFNDIIRNNQIAAESNNLLSALNLARSEALTRGVPVSVCAAAANLTACADAANWSRGWIVFQDDFGGAGTFDPSDTLLQVWEPPANGITVTTTATAVTYSRMARSESAETFRVTKAGCSGIQRRQIDVDISGRVGLTRISCT